MGKPVAMLLENLTHVSPVSTSYGVASVSLEL